MRASPFLFIDATRCTVCAALTSHQTKIYSHSESKHEANMSQNHVSSNGPLTEDELTRAAKHEAAGTYKDVKPAQVFGKKSNPLLAAELRRNNAPLYRALKTEYAYQTGTIKRPVED
jgi:hypothetical protein